MIINNTKKKLGIYVHIPFCERKCNYCDFTSFANVKKESIDEYINALIVELKIRAKTVRNDYIVDTLYFGGGTPSVIDSKHIKEIVSAIKEEFDTNLIEMTIEANPNTFTESKLDDYMKASINRFSIGVQSINDDELKLLGRVHSFKEIQSAVNLLDKNGLNYSCDLMIGILKQTKESLLRTIDFLMERNLKHISVYSLIIEEGTPFYEASKKDTVFASDDEVADMFDLVREKLKMNGFDAYEISNFAKKGFESRHNLKYWKYDDYLGLGVSAYTKMSKTRYGNTKSFEGYINSLKEGKLPIVDIDEDVDDKMYVYLNLRTSFGIDLEDYKKQFSLDFLKEYESRLRKIDKYFEINGKSLRIKTEYFYLADNIVAQLI